MKRTSLVLVIGLSLAACNDGRTASYGDYQEENVTVIGDTTAADSAGDTRITVSTDGGDCVLVSETICVPVDASTSTWCEREGGPVDVVIVDGEVVEVICYPPADGDRVEHVDSTTGDIDLVQSANRTAVVFNDETNGTPLVGDISVDGNNVSIYGNGVDNTIIEGDVVITGNNVRLRGLTITGDLTIGLNSAAVVLCRVLGNVYVGMNNSLLIENDVFGDFTCSSNNNVLSGTDVQGAWTVSGTTNTCDANHSFTDGNANQVVEDEERASLLACP